MTSAHATLPSSHEVTAGAATGRSRKPDVHGVEDLAFADTVVVSDLGLDEPVPPSGIVVSDGTGATQCLVPVAFPPPETADAPGGGGWYAEMRLLWRATAVLDDGHSATTARRVRRLFSFFEWDRADVLRAAWIGVAVFVVVATVGATAIELRSLP